jgi:hypothetical protein
MRPRRKQLPQIQDLGQIGPRVAARNELPRFTGQERRHPRTMTADRAIAMDNDADGHGAGAKRTTEAMIGVRDGDHVAESKPVETEAPHDSKIEELNVAVP